MAEQRSGPASGRTPLLVSFAVVLVVAAVVVLLDRPPSGSSSSSSGRSATSPSARASPPVSASAPASDRAEDRAGRRAERREARRVAASPAPPDAVIAPPVLRVPPGSRGRLPLRVELDAGVSTDPDDDQLGYQWDLDGDGEHDDATWPDPNVTFDRPGRVRIDVIVTDGTGFEDRASVVVRPGTTAPNAPCPVSRPECAPVG